MVEYHDGEIRIRYERWRTADDFGMGSYEYEEDEDCECVTIQSLIDGKDIAGGFLKNHDFDKARGRVRWLSTDPDECQAATSIFLEAIDARLSGLLYVREANDGN